MVVRGWLANLVERGVKPDRRYLFVIDGSKALRGAIEAVFGQEAVQRCRRHKIANVVGYLSEELKDQVKAVMRGFLDCPRRKRWRS